MVVENLKTVDILSSINPCVDEILKHEDSGYGLTLSSIFSDIKGSGRELSLKPFLIHVTESAKFGYVYVIKGTYRGVDKFKIGKANDLKNRVATFEVKLPFDINVIVSFFVKDPTVLESELHYLMKDNRISGEWFDLNQEEIKKLCLVGMSRESGDIAQAIIDGLDHIKRKTLMTDKEYIEYLESLLVIRNIPFSRERQSGKKI